MKNNYSSLFVVLAAGASCKLAAQNDLFDSMHKSLQAMQEQMHSMVGYMEKMNQEMFDYWKKEVGTTPEGLDISCKQQDDKGVKVIITGLVADQFDAAFEDKKLTIKVPAATVILGLEHNMLSISVNQEVRQSEKDDKQSQQKLFASSSQVSQMVPHVLNLEAASLQYNKDSKTLEILLPLKESKKPAKTIPVMVK